MGMVMSGPGGLFSGRESEIFIWRDGGLEESGYGLKAGNLGFEHFTGKVDTAFDGSERFFQNIGYFEIFESVQVQHERFFKDNGKFVCVGLDVFDQYCSL